MTILITYLIMAYAVGFCLEFSSRPAHRTMFRSLVTIALLSPIFPLILPCYLLYKAFR